MTSDPVRQHLQSLPEPPLADELWLRLSARHQRRAGRMRVMRGATLALVLAAAGFWLAPWPASQGDDASQAHQLTAASPDTRVFVIDRALQAAYARGASDEEVAPLWEIRERMILNSATPEWPRRTNTEEST